MSNFVTIRSAIDQDSAFLAAYDPHVSSSMLQVKITAQEILIACVEQQCVGFLRWGWFWDNTPFMNMLFVVEQYRHKGIATRLIYQWEVSMRQNGAIIVLTSTLANETSQHLYRQCGYQDIGGFVLPNEPLELMLYKSLE